MLRQVNNNAGDELLEEKGFPQPQLLRNVGRVTVAETRQDLGNGVHSVVHVRTLAAGRLFLAGMIISPHIPWIVEAFRGTL